MYELKNNQIIEITERKERSSHGATIFSMGEILSF